MGYLASARDKKCPPMMVCTALSLEVGNREYMIVQDLSMEYQVPLVVHPLLDFDFED